MGVLVLLIVLILKGYLVPKSYYDELKQDRDDWKEIGLSQTGAAGKALDIMDRERRRRP